MTQLDQDGKQERFNPNLHLMQIKSGGKDGPKDYLPVQWRLVWFREDCPQGTIETEMTHLDLDRETQEEYYGYNSETRRNEKMTRRAVGFVIFRAVVKDGKGGIATGTKSEKAASFADYIEKAECVPLTSEILTRSGFKHHHELTIGEEVLAYDQESDACVWTPLQRVVLYQNAPLVRLAGSQFEAYCTPEHTWPVTYGVTSQGKAYEYKKLIQTQNLKSSHVVTISAMAPGGDHPLTPRDAAILGWIITDGSLQFVGNSPRSYISQSKPQNVHLLRELVGTLAKEWTGEATTRTFPGGKTYDCLPQHRFNFSADETRRILQAAGISTIADLPAMVFSYSHEARQAMLIAMMLADGDERGNFGKKRKPGVMEVWQILATLEGFAIGAMHLSSVGVVPIQRLKKRRTVCASGLAVTDAGRADVWCPTTAYGTWVMRQNGRVMITGNTGAIGRALAALGYGTQFAPELNEEHRIVDAPVAETPKESATNDKPASQMQRPKVTPAEDRVTRIRALFEEAKAKKLLPAEADAKAFIPYIGQVLKVNITNVGEITETRLATIEKHIRSYKPAQAS